MIKEPSTIKARSFLKNLLVTISGVSIAQALPILAGPLLARIFNFEEFGIFSVFYGASSVLAILFSLKLDSAIVASTDNESGDRSLYLAVVAITSFFAIGLIFLIFTPYHLYKPLIPSSALGFAILLNAVLMSTYFIFLSFLLRHLDFNGIAQNRVVRSLVILGVTLLLYFIGVPFNPLVLGVLIGQSVATTFIIWKVFQLEYVKKFGVLHLRSFTKTVQILKSNRHFVLYSTPASFFNSLAVYLPVFMLTTFVTTEVAGYYGFTQRVIAVPVGIIAVSLSDVYKQKMAELYSSRKLEIKSFLERNLKNTIAILLPLTIFLYLFIDQLVLILFGKEWMPIIPIIKFFAPVYFLVIIVSPLTSIIYITGKQYWEFIINTIYLVLGFCALYYGIVVSKDWMLGLYLFATLVTLMYLFTFVICSKIVLKEHKLG